MKIALVSPKTHSLQHRVRGSGFYIENLKKSLLKCDKRNSYVFLSEGENLPKDIDLVHYPYFEPFFLTLPLIKKAKTIVTIHDLTPLVFPNFFPKGARGGFKWQIQRRSLKNANAIITDSKSSKKDIIKFTGVDKEKIHSVYLAAGEEFRKLEIINWKLKITKRYNLPERFALYVGDITWNKNLPRLVEAIKKVNVPLVLVGKALVDKDFDKSNPWNQDLAKVQEFIESDNLFVRLGFISDKELVMLYNIATLFVMPSLYEGFGLPILEAMNCGCPVVTSKEGSLPEVAGDAVFYVDAYNVNSISGGILKIFKDKKFQDELSTKGLIQAKKFSWEKTATETIKAYESV